MVSSGSKEEARPKAAMNLEKLRGKIPANYKLS